MGGGWFGSHTYNASGAVEVRALSKVYFDRTNSTLNADLNLTRPPWEM